MTKPLARSLLISGLLVNSVFAQTPDTEKAAQEPAKLTIPDGTRVILRFAQPVVGVPQMRPLKPIEHAKKGDVIQLVVASDIRVDSMIVVKKGSPAQATVMEAKVPDRQFADSGMQLRFDWIKSVDGKEVPIRQKRKGDKSGKFAAYVFTTRTGSFIPFGWDHRPFSFKDMLRDYMKIKTWQQWTVIPTGTRARAFVLGDIALDAAEVKSALAELPSPNPTATVTIYREKESQERRHVICDKKDLGELDNWQYFLIEIDPGKHSCHLDQGGNLDFSVSAGEEFYLHIHRGGFSGKWDLKAEDAATGEDAITFSEPVGTTLAPPPSQP